MFGSLGVPELLLIFFVILVVFGPRRIPEIGRTLGKALGEFKKATDDLKNTIEREVRLEELKQVVPSIVTPLESISRSGPVSLQGVESSSLQADAAAGSSTTRPLEDSTTLPLEDSKTRRLEDSKTSEPAS
jgi:TatA/E family protein of Tat protein translocase